MNFFSKRPRTPAELVRGLRDAVPRLEQGPPGGEVRRRAQEDVTKTLAQVKALLLGDGEPAPELVAQLAQEAYGADLLLVLVQHVARFEFESRKDVVQIFNHLLRRQIGSRCVRVYESVGKGC
jgi:calcium binding protein 39